MSVSGSKVSVKGPKCLKILMSIKTKYFFAPSVILRLIFRLLQVHIIPRELVGVAIGHSNYNLVKQFVDTGGYLAILKHNFHSVHCFAFLGVITSWNW